MDSNISEIKENIILYIIKPLLQSKYIENLVLGETLQHELNCATIGFMFITIIRHIKSLIQIEFYFQIGFYLNKRFNVPDDCNKHETNGRTF